MAVTKNTKVWDKIRNDVLRSPTISIDVGWFGVQYGEENDHLPVATVAAWMEHGHPYDYPPRPFIRQGFIPRLRGKEYRPYFAQVVKNMLTGQGSVLSQAHVLGALMRKGLQNEIIAWDTPPNSENTVSKKGFNDPLIETGYMLETVDYRIRKEGVIEFI